MNHSNPEIKKYAEYTKASGFTLLELMITIAIVGIFLTVAIPSYTDFIARNRVDVEIQEFRTILSLARSQAIKQNRSVTVTAVNDWEDGYVMALASVENAATAADEDIFRRYTPEDNGGITPTPTAGGTLSTEITYRGTGLLAVDNPIVLEFCSDDTTEDRRITINVTGRYSSEIFECPTT